MNHYEPAASPTRTANSDEIPHQFQGSLRRENTRNDDGSENNGDPASTARSTHEPMLFSSSHRVNSEVDKAYREDETSSWKQRPDQFWLTLWKFVRPGFFLDHLDYKSFKIVSRTWALVFFSIMMLVVTRFQHYVGVTSYLGVILSNIEAAGGISYSQAVYTSFADLVLILFSFTCAIIGHAISWRIRGYPTAEGLMKQLSDEGVCSFGDQTCFIHQIHEGRYLSTKTTVVMLFAIFFSLLLTGYLSQKIRLFLLPQILGSITLVICSLYLNMTPQFSPWTYGRAIILPFGLSLSARVVLSFIWFPVSSNYKFFSIVDEAFVSTTTILKENINQLENMKPSSDEFALQVAQVASKIEGALGKFALLELEGVFCRGEICFSRFDPGDLGEFRALARMLTTSLVGFSFFFDEILEKKNVIVSHSQQSSLAEDLAELEKQEAYDTAQGLGIPTRPSKSPNDSTSQSKQKTPETRKRMIQTLVSPERRDTLSQIHADQRKARWLNSKLTRVYAPAGHFEDDRLEAALKLGWDHMKLEDLDELYPQIIAHYKGIGDAIFDLLVAVSAWAHAANEYRVLGLILPFYRKKHKRLQAENAERVENALNALADVNAEKDQRFAEWAEEYSAKHSSRSAQHYINILSTDAFHGCTIRRVVWAATKLGEYCAFLDHHQKKPRLVYPFMPMRSKSPRFESEYLLSGSVGSDAADQAFMPYEPHENVQRRDPDSTPPRNYFHLVGRQIMKLFSITRDPQVQFAAKRAIFTLLASLTYCTRTTLLFSYSYRLAWVPIMVAVTISFQALDGVYGFLAKVYFTFFGCLIGMVVWYIGVGSERGNPYGFTAALGVVFVFLVFYRHFNTHTVPMGSIILCVTTVIVAGTSWNNSKMMPADVKLGWGWHIAWIRFVCVVAGVGIAFIGTLLPKPVTAKKNIRVMLSTSLEQLGDIQTSLCNFGLQRHRDQNVHIAARQDAIRVKLRRVGVTIGAGQQLANRLDYEPPLGGLWPKHRYLLLLRLVGQLGHIMGAAHYLLDNIEDTSRVPSMLQIMGWTNVELMSSMYSVLVLGSRSLAMAKPLPSVTPGHLSEIYSRILRERFEYDLKNESLEPIELITKRYVDRDGRTNLALVIFMHMMFTRIDACVRLVKGLVGEIYGVDLDVFKYDPEAGFQKNETAINDNED